MTTRITRLEYIMNRKIRHPYQIIELSEMIIGKRYAFIFHVKNSTIDVEDYVFGGIIQDSFFTAQQRGYDLNLDKIGSIAFIDSVDDNIFTVHMDGWTQRLKPLFGGPITTYWNGNQECGYDSLKSWVGKEECPEDDDCSLIVPSRHWNNDPKIHVLDWINPDETVQRAIECQTQIPTNWEDSAKKKQDEIWKHMCR